MVLDGTVVVNSDSIGVVGQVWYGMVLAIIVLASVVCSVGGQQVCSQPGKNRIWGSSSQRLRPGAVLPPSRDHYT